MDVNKTLYAFYKTHNNNNNNNFIFFYLNASTLNNTDTVRPGGGEKTLRSSRLPPPIGVGQARNWGEGAQEELSPLKNAFRPLP